MKIKICGLCEQRILLPFGPVDAPIIILWNELTLEEYQRGWFTSETSGILRTEFAKGGVDLWQFRQTSLWLHEPLPKNKQEKEWHLKNAIAECENRKAVLLLGSECTKLFLPKYTATDVSGIPMKSDLLSTVPLVMGTLAPSAALGSSHGEFRLGIQSFLDHVKDLL